MPAHEQLIETFAINNRINLYLLDAIKEEHLMDLYLVLKDAMWANNGLTCMM
jgi:hypothetical protein